MLRLAWQFLRHDRAKSLGALLGSVVSVFLIGQQLGIATFLTDAMVAPVRLTTADLWVVDAKSEDVNALGVLDARVLRQVASTPGVARAVPVVLAGASARFGNGVQAGITLLGAEAPTFRGLPPLESGVATDLLRDGALGFDRFDSPSYGGAEIGTTLEINGQAAFLAVRSAGLRTFTQPILFGPIERVRRLAGLPATAVHAVLVDLAPGATREAVAARLDATINGTRAWAPQALARATQGKLLATTGIAASIGTLIGFAILVGFVIIGLTLYSAVVDRLRDYGTMKAIGARDGDVTRVVLLQAALVALVGGAVGSLLILGFRAGVAQTGLLFSFGASTWSALILGTVAIAGAGAAFAIRRLRAVEPAAVFRS
ncbi:MAG: ABC transporter permease [Gemmatimonadaceae bacterium]|nr:ABC transporter permease [Gemmatimonadaceae bacterium]